MRLFLSILVALAGCGAHRVMITGALAVDHQPAAPVAIAPRTPASITIPGHGGQPDVEIPAMAQLLAATFHGGEGDMQIALAIRSLDLDATEPGDEHLALVENASVYLTHGGAPDVHGLRTPSPHYVRIGFEAELRRGDTVLAQARGTVTGTKRVGHSEADIRAAIASALDRLVLLLDRALLAPRTALDHRRTRAMPRRTPTCTRLPRA